MAFFFFFPPYGVKLELSASNQITLEARQWFSSLVDSPDSEMPYKDLLASFLLLCMLYILLIISQEGMIQIP